jgi:hypothetical protein
MKDTKNARTKEQNELEFQSFCMEFGTKIEKAKDNLFEHQQVQI